MRNKKLFLIILVAIISILWASQVSSFSRRMHRDLNERIAQRVINNFSLNNYLIDQLDFKSGIDEKLEKDSIKKEVWKWLGEGGDKEDEPDGLLPMVVNKGRSNSHFHNPLGGLWEYSGLDVRIGPLHYTGQSSILWAQNPNQDPGGKWSWYDARDYFHKGLTLNDKAERESAMANTFRALGQLMHLTQDASVPAHVRNQIHVLFNYETWLLKRYEIGRRTPLTNLSPTQSLLIPPF